jgi:putative transposase
MYAFRLPSEKLSKRIDEQLALDALEVALAAQDVSPGLIHSDRGMQYAGTASVDRLNQVSVRISMSSVGNPYGNAKAESVLKTLKQEEASFKDSQNFQEEQANIAHFIEEVYSIKRLHSSLATCHPLSSRWLLPKA